jgi:hypothetical protein
VTKALLVAMIAACGATYDPVDEVPHSYRELPDTATAILTILAENPPPRVYAIGEYHQSRTAIARTSPLARFTREIISLLEPHAKQLVIEAWLDHACDSSAQLAHDVAAVTGRPAATQMEMLRLVDRGQQAGLQLHTLPMTCIEQDAMIDAHVGVNFLMLLELITDKLHATTRALAETDPQHAVIVYGGALHNDLYPRWPLEELSYARPLAHELGDHSVLEIDLVVPEVVMNMSLVRDEAWFPLLARVAPQRVLVWQRGPGSYVVILPAQPDTFEAVARVAKL